MLQESVPYLQALVLGLVQGLAEFLPISSSAHLALTPYLFGWRDPGLAFDVALHLGTLCAVLWYFRADWTELARAAIGMVRHPHGPIGPMEKRVVFLMLATLPAAVAGVFLDDLAESVFRAPVITAVALIVLGIVLWVADRVARADRDLASLGISDALLIGFAQILALVPGVSRSGSTMTAGRLLRFDRASAARFSFLMSMPITAAAVVIKMPEALRLSSDPGPLIVGILAAGLSGWLAISVLLRYLARHSFGVFAVYRVVLGLVVLWVVRGRG